MGEEREATLFMSLTRPPIYLPLSLFGFFFFPHYAAGFNIRNRGESRCKIVCQYNCFTGNLQKMKWGSNQV